jgi:NADH:ubiquinone oxidoreductase subunit F (NADH-binding)
MMQRPVTPEAMAGQSVLEMLDRARGSGVPGTTSVQEAARSMRLPVAAVRGVISWYADLHADPDAIRVCRGTSCVLAGAQHLAEFLAHRHRCRHVYCVGHCDRSPVVLMPDGQVAIRCRVAEGDGAWGLDPVPQPPPPDVRSTAKRPVVTGRLLHGGCHELSTAREAGAYASLTDALRAPPERILATIEQSGLRGRGGAGFATGRKWRTCALATGDRKYVIANGDEGDPGSFIDRELMERDPHSILEGMILAAYAVGAQDGIVFVRSEYPHAVRVMRRAIAEAHAAGLLGPPVGDRRFTFDVRVVTGLGSYVCGEETAMLNAIEGKRGEARPRPPYPTEHGLYGRPTLVDNVETLVNVPWIVRHGAAQYRAMGTASCPGTKALCLNHGFVRPGIVEIEFGAALGHVIEGPAGGAAPGKTLDAVLLGGPMGSVVPAGDWDVPVCLDAMALRGIRLGHGGLVALPRGTDYAVLLRHMLEFMAEESCGKCVPCRIGTQRAVELIHGNEVSPESLQALARVFDLMEQASLCGFGRETPGPVRRIIKRLGPNASKAMS